MRKITALICFLLPIVGSAQYNNKEIAAKKISKMVVSSDDGTQTYYYDRKGNDTAYYDGEKRYYWAEYNYDAKGRILKRIRYYNSGEQTDTANHVYAADGSCKVTIIDNQFHMKNYEWYDKSGRMTKSQSPDGNATLYSYNTKGQLISVKSNGANQGTIINNQYTYNSKGQCIKDESKGDYKSTVTYSYDSKGFLVQSIVSYQEDGVPKKGTYSYKYEFWN